ncbi:MAG: S-adenosylmethionine:tRNA ribosyltransferase-isomerase, partial [Bacteroidales bacterium]|nr:S-adenosylmethionine:tRNA ribosyltransferase-isomerase [Bacteroidales bacterium]
MDYTLPQNRIAKYPLSQRDNSKLLLYKNGKISAERFSNIVNFLPKDSFLVFNDSKVIHARLLFQKSTGANIEIFCIEPIEPQEFSQNFSAPNTVIWKCLVGNAKKWKSGFIEKQIPVNNQPVRLLAEKINYKENHVTIRFSWETKVTFGELISKAGKIPIPPYLNRDSEPLDTTRYQTIYAKTNGSVAAPTAVLHFTETIFSGLKKKNIQHGFVTLHVSAGTFKPVKS